MGGFCFRSSLQSNMSLLLSTSTDSLIATGICKLGSLEYEITTGATELTLKPAAGEEIQGAAVVDYLLNIASVAKGSEPAEQKLVSKTRIGALQRADGPSSPRTWLRCPSGRPRNPR